MIDESWRPNKLLAALPPEERDRIWESGEVVWPRVRENVYTPGKPIRHVYFPLGAVFSLVTRMADGTIMEVSTIGSEGVVGLSVFLGAETSPLEAFPQIKGPALRIESEVFLQFAVPDGQLHAILSRYAYAVVVLLSQSVACNRLHTLEPRFARWLLTIHDQVDGDELQLTHEFLAEMLGVRRASISEAAQRLQELGAISYRRGNIEILDRPVLESIACECYDVIRDELTRVVR